MKVAACHANIFSRVANACANVYLFWRWFHSPCGYTKGVMYLEMPVLVFFLYQDAI